MIYCFVEGPDDETFFKKLFLCGFDSSKFLFYLYARKKKQDVNNFLKTLKQRDDDYMFFVDADGKPTDERMKDCLDKYPYLKRENIFIIYYEIESWYLAGLSQENAMRLGITKYIPKTDDITKEGFNKLIDKCNDTRLQVMLNIMEVYESLLANNRNRSFSIFYKAKCNFCI